MYQKNQIWENYICLLFDALWPLDRERSLWICIKNKANNMKYDIFNIRNNINYICFRRMTSDKATDSRVDKHPKRKVTNQIIIWYIYIDIDIDIYIGYNWYICKIYRNNWSIWNIPWINFELLIVAYHCQDSAGSNGSDTKVNKNILIALRNQIVLQFLLFLLFLLYIYWLAGMNLSPKSSPTLYHRDIKVLKVVD